ncbi:cupin domain-containing protein [Ruixingdingia sedimenti]|uniref:Cupin domain-containing protein n=1 Tax=Ruixingdingia sedimenti TaxID=3073604 RepID=A0ABU1F854_9RHOB|nr:cupin domain-containing protein [Xinfangfangia sp. LG-4]MDR5653046.1 cupin domain-containing protein [Xinfangfangia sp. LG-4]
MEDFDVGTRLRGLRLHRGLSQRQLAEAAGVPHGQISMIETNRCSPSVASMRKILSGLSMSMAEFFEPDQADSAQVFFTAAERRDLTSRLPGAARVRIAQVGDARAHNLQVLHETYEPGADTGRAMLAHASTEGGIVVAGEIEVTVGDQVRLLREGDGYLFDSIIPHRFRNLSDRPAVIISACTPPYL